MAGVKGLSGGRRPGAGRKPLDARTRDITGNAGHRGRLLPYPGLDAPPVPPPSQPFPCPDTWSPAERGVWAELAPHAFANRTLTPATLLAFRVLVRNVLLERTLAESPMFQGGPNHRGLLMRVDAELLRFNLAPCGKPLTEPEQAAVPVNPLARFLAPRR